MITAKNVKAIDLLERSVADLKGSVKTLISTSKGMYPELSQLLHSMLGSLDSGDAGFVFSQLVNEYNKKTKIISRDKAEEHKAARIDLVEVIKKCSEKSLSTTQFDLLSSLTKKARDLNISNEALLSHFGETLLIVADDIEETRRDATQIVGENHSHIKQNSANVIAADIQAASKRLTREISQVSKKLSGTYLYDSELKKLSAEAADLENKPNQFFRSLELLQDLNKHISNLIEKERRSSQEMLIDIQSKIVNVFKQSSELSDSIHEGAVNTDNLDADLTAKLDMLKSKAASADSVEDLQKIIAESISSLSSTVGNFSTKQNKSNIENKKQIKALSNELKSAKKQINDIQEKLNSAEEEVLVDQLSQLGNRRGYLINMRKAHELWSAGKQKLSVIVIDIDNFKNINDSHGHAIGDQVIKKIGSIVNENTRDSDYVARYGGEEFVVICNETSVVDAAMVAERIRSAISKRTFRLRNTENKLVVTASFGVSEFTEKRPDIVAVFHSADKAMYEAKQKGKNKVVMVNNNKLLLVPKN